MNTEERNKILFVGLNTIDIQFLVNAYPPSNTKIKASQNEIVSGGPATNAIACAFLGGSADLVTPIGKHSMTEFLHEDLTKHQVRLIDPHDGEQGQPTFASIVTDEANGERTIFSYHPEIKVNELVELNISLKKYKLVLFDGFHPELAIPLALKCREEGIITVFDGGSWKPQTPEILPLMDIALCSADFHIPDSQGSMAVIDYLQQSGIGKVAITRGGKTILYSENGSKGEIEIENITVADTLGAGDIFHGSFCYYYVSDCNFVSAIQKAAKVASHSCKYFGTRKWMQHQPEKAFSNLNS